MSDEHNEKPGPYLYDCDEIVADILKQKKILPTLIGINKELDELIEESLKG